MDTRPKTTIAVEVHVLQLVLRFYNFVIAPINSVTVV